MLESHGKNMSQKLETIGKNKMVNQCFPNVGKKMESFPKNGKLQENHCGGKFTELGNFGGKEVKKQLIQKQGKILGFSYFPFLGKCWRAMGKTRHRNWKLLGKIKW